MKLEVFFDYACPYCKRGHELLVPILAELPMLEAEWRPCEAHPRPESYGRHSDLLARAMLFAREHGVELMPLHERLYRAAHVDRVNIEDPAAVAGLLEGLLDTRSLLASLKAGEYQEELAANNRLAWGTHAFAAVPSLVLGERTLRSVEDIGLSAAMMREFFREITVK